MAARLRLGALILGSFSFFGCGSVATTPASGPVLVWSDEFDGETNASPDGLKWAFDIGGGGWGNNELESYTSRPDNAHLDGNGNLVLRAKRESYTGSDGISRAYTSARLKTQGLLAQSYGRFEARIKIPYGQGLWPAFWMLGQNIDSVGWPDCGEIDIMENIGREPAIVHGTFHGPGFAGAGVGAAYSLPGNQPFSDDFHVYAVEWEPTEVRWYVDSTLYETRTRADIPAGGQWVFDHPFFVILNVAVGGDWGGPPDQKTVFPQQMAVDYVRVYSLPSP